MRIKSPRVTSSIRRVPTSDAVAQGRHAVGDAGQLFEAMGDVDDSDTVRLQLGDHAEEPLDLLVAERGRRLVHDQDSRVGPQGPGNLDELLLGHRQAADLASGSIAAPIRSSRARARARRAVPAHGPPRVLALEPDRDVLGDGQVREEGRLLIDRRDSQLARLDRIEVLDRPALDLDRSVVRKMRAGDHLDQRRLARAVFTDQGVDFAGPEVERDLLERLDSGKRLADSVSSSNVDKCRFPLTERFGSAAFRQHVAFVRLDLRQPVCPGGHSVRAAVMIPDRTDGQRLQLFEKRQPRGRIALGLEPAEHLGRLEEARARAP